MNAPSKEASLTEAAVHEFDTVSCVLPEDNRSVDHPDIQNLIEGIRANGQLVPGLVCPHPEIPAKYEVLDGARRWFACGKLGIPFRAMLLPAAVPEAERIKLRLQHNVIRRNMSMDEIADDAARYMALLNCTQEEAARELTLSSATISRALAVKRRIPPELKAMAEAVKPSIASMIAALPDANAMRRAFEHATTPGRNGRYPTREQMSVFIRPLKKKESNTRAKVLRGTVDGRRVELGVLPDDSTETVIKFLQSLVTKLGKYRELPPDSLGFLFDA